jgi:hypothetical protein
LGETKNAARLPVPAWLVHVFLIDALLQYVDGRGKLKVAAHKIKSAANRTRHSSAQSSTFALVEKPQDLLNGRWMVMFEISRLKLDSWSAF